MPDLDEQRQDPSIWYFAVIKISFSESPPLFFEEIVSSPWLLGVNWTVEARSQGLDTTSNGQESTRVFFFNQSNFAAELICGVYIIKTELTLG